MKKSNLFLPIPAFVIVLLFIFTQCSKMDDTYKHFLEGGQIKYIGRADDVNVLPGRNRLALTWLRSPDPSVAKAKIYWNNKTDSLEVPIDNSQDVVTIPIEDMPEGSYTFEIITFDAEGNNSVTVEAVGRSFGITYENSLLSRFVESTSFVEESILEVIWTNVTDSTLIRTELIYEDDNNVTDTIYIESETRSIELTDFSRGILKFRSLYEPAPQALDIFYSKYDSIRVKGLPLEIDKAGWTATASSFDDRSGASYRPPSNTIDNIPTTIWVNKIGAGLTYPHWLQVDMGKVHENIEGFAIITRVGDAASRPKTVELQTSIDGEDWVSFGDFVLENSGDKQFLSIPEPVIAQYFKMIAKDAHDSGNNIALAEIGVFSR